MLGHPRPAGTHSDLCGLQGLLRDGLEGQMQVPPNLHLTVSLPVRAAARDPSWASLPHHPLAVGPTRAGGHRGDTGVPSCP